MQIYTLPTNDRNGDKSSRQSGTKKTSGLFEKSVIFLKYRNNLRIIIKQSHGTNVIYIITRLRHSNNVTSVYGNRHTNNIAQAIRQNHCESLKMSRNPCFLIES